jgi:hypothetical protein
MLEQFIANCRAPRNTKGRQFPWYLLIVDEAHNLMSSNFGQDSDLSEMLRLLMPVMYSSGGSAGIRTQSGSCYSKLL